MCTVLLYLIPHFLRYSALIPSISTSLFCYLVPDAASEYYLPLATTLLYSSTVPLVPSLRVPPISTVQVPVVVLLLGRVPPKGLI